MLICRALSMGEHYVLGDPSDGGPDPRARGSGVTEVGSSQIQRVVVIEDEVFIRLDIERQLQAAGYEVVGAGETAADAVRLAEVERPDLIIMDIRLVGAHDGIDAAIEVWQRYQIRSLFVSANIDAHNKARALAAHPWGFLAKPFTPASLRAAIERSH
jgi:CheY-like chemotaxis protein